MSKPKVVVIVGPTSSGKTSLSILLAKEFNGEVISADSRQVYKGLDIGTGKATAEEMDGVTHHLLDITDPNRQYSVSDFARDGEKAFGEIFSRSNLPIIAGGTFFYVDTLLGRISTPSVPPNETLRKELETKDVEELYEILKSKDSKRAESIDKMNPRRLMRAIEIAEALGEVPEVHQEEKYDVLTIGIEIDKETLRKQIEKRLEERLMAGMVNEVLNLLEEGVGYERLAELGIEYKYISLHLRGDIDENEMKKQIKNKSWQYAKRQMTWLKKDKSVHWVKSTDFNQAVDMVRKFLKK